ncbi:MAG: PepSY domain-containing protein, partial [Pseudomonadota bacterium]
SRIGRAFKAVRAEMGWQKGVQDWTIGGRAPATDEHAEHNHGAMMGAMDHRAMGHAMNGHVGHGPAGVFLTEIVARARGEHLPFPVIVTPPGAPAKFGQNGKAGWTVRSDTPNRPLRVSITYDAKTGRETTREAFTQKHPIDRVIGYGVAWHEGQLCGWVNQAIGVLTALMLITMSLSGFVMWRRRKPAGVVGAPPQMRAGTVGKGVWVALCVLAALLPLLALSLASIFVIERALLKRIPKLSAWLGL